MGSTLTGVFGYELGVTVGVGLVVLGIGVDFGVVVGF